MKVKILTIESKSLLIEQMKYCFEKEDFEIFMCDENEILKKDLSEHYDILVLSDDIKKDSLSLCREIRELSNIPIIVTTNSKEDLTRIMALEFGADDCMAYPFNILELKARIKAILRRVNKSKRDISSVLEVGDFKINTLGRKISHKENDINLTGKEFDLFLLLITNSNKIFNRTELLEKIWGYGHYADLRTVDVHIRRLREKIEKNASHPKYILTKWGCGYYFKNS